jgi:hypothetical protein
MATASRTRQPAGAKPGPRSASLTALRAHDALTSWLIPAVAVGAVVLFAILAALSAITTAAALAGTLLALLVILLFIGLRPLLVHPPPARSGLLAATLGVLWLVACYLPFHARLFPGPPLVAGVTVTAAGSGLPLRIPAAGRRSVDIVLEGSLVPQADGGIAPPVDFTLTVVDEAGATNAVTGRFEDTLRSRRLGRRGRAVVHQLHTAERHTLSNPGRQDLTLTHLTLQPENARPITISAFAHPLPPPLVLGIAAAVLLITVVAFDRLGPAPETDGALTLGTAAVLGSALIFWTSDAAHPDFQTLIGAAIFGGLLGYAGGGLLWWTAKRVIVRSP